MSRREPHVYDVVLTRHPKGKGRLDATVIGVPGDGPVSVWESETDEEIVYAVRCYLDQLAGVRKPFLIRLSR